MTPTAGELAKYLKAELTGDPRSPISGVAGPDNAGAEDLIYLDSPRHQARVANSAARCVLASPGTRVGEKTIVEVSDPKLAFAKAAAWLMPRVMPASRKGAETHPTAVVALSARVAANAVIGPYVVVEDRVEIGAGTVVEAFCFLGCGVRLGEDCRLHSRVTLYPEAKLGNRVEVHSGAVIGSDGFGYVFGENRWWKFPQIGNVEIGDDVEIGSNATIDRGSLGTTRIGAGVKIDSLVQVAHNVEIGENSVIASQVGIAGSSKLGKRVILGGQVGIADHCTLEDESVVGAQGGVPTGKTIRRGQTVWGTPARPLDQFKKQFAWAARIPALAERVRRLEGVKKD